MIINIQIKPRAHKKTRQDLKKLRPEQATGSKDPQTFLYIVLEQIRCLGSRGKRLRKCGREMGENKEWYARQLPKKS